MRASLALGLAGLTGCNAIFGLQPPIDRDAADASGPDVAIEGGWSTPTPIAIAATGLVEDDPAITPDDQELLFSVLNPDENIMSSTRLPGTDAWQTPILAVGLDSAQDDGGIHLATIFNQQWAYIATNRGGGLDIYSAVRTLPGGMWMPPMFEPGLSSAADETGAAPCLGRTRFVVSSTRDGASQDLFEVTGSGAAAIAELSSPVDESGPFLTEDCLTLYYASRVAGTYDIYVVHRDSLQAPWGNPAIVDVSTPDHDEGDPWISADGHHMLFASNQRGNFDIFEAFR